MMRCFRVSCLFFVAIHWCDNLILASCSRRTGDENRGHSAVASSLFMLGLLDELLPSQVEKKAKKETGRKERIISERYEKVISSLNK